MTDKTDSPNNEEQKANAPDGLDLSGQQPGDSADKTVSGATETEKSNPPPNQQQESKINQGLDKDGENQQNSGQPEKPGLEVGKINPDSPDDKESLEINQGEGEENTEPPSEVVTPKSGTKEQEERIQDNEENAELKDKLETSKVSDRPSEYSQSEEQDEATGDEPNQKNQERSESKDNSETLETEVSQVQTVSDEETEAIGGEPNQNYQEHSGSEESSETSDLQKLQEQISTLKQNLEAVKEEKEQAISILQKRIHVLEEQLKEFISKMRNLNPRLKIIEAAFNKYQEQSEKDLQDFNAHSKQFERLQQQGSKLQESIESVDKNFQQKLLEYKPQPLQVPGLEQKLKQRQESLQLIGKMLGRLPEKSNFSVNDQTLPTELPKITEPELIENVKANTDNEFELAINKKLKQLGDKRFRVVSNSKNLVARYHKHLLNFIQTKVLPILDSIDDGEKYSRELKTECADVPNVLDSLLRLHDDLRKTVLNMLELVKIRPIEVEIGKKIDYNCHLPFETQPDKNLPDEIIKEVTRKGYEYQLEESEKWQVLRAAQVIVVKND